MTKLERVGSENFGIGQLYKEMAAVSRSRLLLQEANISIRNTPLGGETFAEQVKTLTANSIAGFGLVQRAADFTKTELQDFLKLTKPLYPASLSGATIVKPLELVNAFTQVQATLLFLNGKGQFSFADIETPIDGYDLGETELRVSYWRNSATPENMWSLVNKLDEITNEALYSPEDLATEQLLFIGHFFTAGAVLANKVM